MAKREIGALAAVPMTRNQIQLSKTISHALRHEPWLYELELDEDGWTDVEVLLEALRARRKPWRGLTVADVEEVMAAADKQRFELRDGRIRAFYGHSTPQRLRKTPAEPPSTLYHGTSPAAAEIILREGLRPMSRQFVHLSSDVETATLVGGRKASAPLLLEIDAAAGHAAGVAFYEGNEMVWLADEVPARFIRRSQS